MKRFMQLVTAGLVLVGAATSAFAGTEKVVIMGHRTVIADANGVEFVTCPGPHDVVCETCGGKSVKVGPSGNTGVFFYDISNPSVGLGYTNVILNSLGVNANGDELVTFSILPGNQFYATYSAWLAAM